MNQHSNWLNNIKKVLKASHVSYDRYKDIYHLKVIKNKETKYFPLTGNPTDVTNEKYMLLTQQLLDYYGEV